MLDIYSHGFQNVHLDFTNKMSFHHQINKNEDLYKFSITTKITVHYILYNFYLFGNPEV